MSALQDFISWLESCRGSSEGVLLVAHEPQRKVVVPLLLEALAKYRLEESFKAVVSGFVSSSDAIEALGDSNTITSLSLRSLCKTVLGDTSLPTSSATQRCSALLAILARVVAAEGAVVPADKLLPFSTSVAAEQRQLGQLKDVLGTQVRAKKLLLQGLLHPIQTQGTLRPIFEAQLKQKRVVRERAMALRRTIAEVSPRAGLTPSWCYFPSTLVTLLSRPAWSTSGWPPAWWRARWGAGWRAPGPPGRTSPRSRPSSGSISTWGRRKGADLW